MEQSQLEFATPGKVVVADSINTFDSRFYYDLNQHKYICTTKIHKSRLNTNNTYITIFNLNSHYYGQEQIGSNTEQYKCLKEDPDIKIIWESEMAVNRRSGHGTKPRNKMVVWEFAPKGALEEFASAEAGSTNSSPNI